MTNMTLSEAILQRHSCRTYRNEPLGEEVLVPLREKIGECNREGGLHIQLVTEEPKAFTGILSYGVFKGVRNYLVMAGRRADDLDEKVGYYGEQLVLLAQTLGLSTCWVGLTYRRTPAFSLGRDEKLVCVIALGYGEGGYRQHRVKTVEELSNACDLSPKWFVKGVQAAQQAPTAINQQKFYFEFAGLQGSGKPVVIARRGFSLVGYTRVDLGIAKCHFEIGAGRDSFIWG